MVSFHRFAFTGLPNCDFAVALAFGQCDGSAHVTNGITATCEIAGNQTKYALVSVRASGPAVNALFVQLRFLNAAGQVVGWHSFPIIASWDATGFPKFDPTLILEQAVALPVNASTASVVVIEFKATGQGEF